MSSALISSSQKNILIDTSPDIKSQLLKNKIKNIDRIFYTHPHADQTHGINELRAFYIKNNKKLPVYGDIQTKKQLFSTFSYINYNRILSNKKGYVTVPFFTIFLKKKKVT